MADFSFGGLSMRARLALILGVTIFALAATRAFGLSQLGGFLERFRSYGVEIAAAQQALNSAQHTAQALAQQLLAARAGETVADADTMRQRAYQRADELLERLEAASSAAGVEAPVLQALRDAHRAHRAFSPEGKLNHPQAAAVDQVVAAIEQRLGVLQRQAGAAHEREAAIMNRTYVTMLLLVFGAGGLAYWLIVRMITRPLARVAEVADTVARGDFRSEVAVHGSDELSAVMRALRDMNQGLAQLIREMRGVSHSVLGGSEALEAATGDFARRINSQSAALAQTAVTLNGLSEGVVQVAQNARQASEKSADASAIATKGREEVSRVAAMMGEIERSARRITEIIAVIDGIAFQTNLLALNAAVEAARAGESGRGFAVVAAEVRHLARKSADAAREVRTLIEDSLSKVERGAGATQSAAHTMSHIVDSAHDVTRLVGEIDRLAGAQASGMREVNLAVSEMDRTTRQNTETIKHTARSAHAMRGQAMVLNKAIAAFKLRGDAAAAVRDSSQGTSRLALPVAGAR